MRIAFIHRPGGDWIQVTREDGSEGGFWGLVADGVDFAAVNEAGGRFRSAANEGR